MRTSTYTKAYPTSCRILFHGSPPSSVCDWPSSNQDLDHEARDLVTRQQPRTLNSPPYIQNSKTERLSCGILKSPAHFHSLFRLHSSGFFQHHLPLQSQPRFELRKCGPSSILLYSLPWRSAYLLNLRRRMKRPPKQQQRHAGPGSTARTGVVLRRGVMGVYTVMDHIVYRC